MSEITFTLPNFPQLNQLHEPTSDGQPDENASWNCVPASIADGLGFLTGRTFDGDELKDAVYGQGYQGAQEPARYVNYCAHQGVSLTPYNGTPAQLVAKIHAEVAAGHPVVATIPSQWGIPVADQKPGYTTHVVCFCGEGPGALRADNPWIAPTWHDGGDAYWAARLCFGQVWVMAGEETPTVGTPAGWKDDGKVLTAPNGQTVTLGFRDHILTTGWFPGDMPLGDARGTAPGQTQQDFRYTVLTWSAATNVVEHDRCDLLSQQVTALTQELAAATAQIAQLQAQLANTPQSDPRAEAALKLFEAQKALLAQV